MHILLGDHHEQARQAIRKMLVEEPELELVGEAADGDALLRLAATQSPDLILLDSLLPGGPIEDLLAGLHAGQPRPIVIAMSSDADCSRKLLKVGADAFVSKTDRPAWMRETLQMYAKRAKKGDSP